MSTLPISLTIHPACGLPGEYSYETDSRTLVRLLKDKTDLPSSVIERFTRDLRICTNVRLFSVKLSEQLLTELGYFID